MEIDWVREYCLSLPHATETIQWEDDLVFKVGGKMFAVMPLERGHLWISFKCSLEEFAELIERPGIIPAPYLARAHWVALETPRALPRVEIERLLHSVHALVLAKLPKKVQEKFRKSRPKKSGKQVVRMAPRA
jgi:predicted DNA-binding protein (MmcQ/YjbR family)